MFFYKIKEPITRIKEKLPILRIASKSISIIIKNILVSFRYTFQHNTIPLRNGVDYAEDRHPA